MNFEPPRNQLQEQRQKLTEYLKAFKDQIVMDPVDFIIVNTVIYRLETKKTILTTQTIHKLCQSFKRHIANIGWNGITTNRRIYNSYIARICLFGGELAFQATPESKTKVLESVIEALRNYEKLITNIVDDWHIEVNMSLAHARAYLVKTRESLQEHLHPNK